MYMHTHTYVKKQLMKAINLKRARRGIGEGIEGGNGRKK